MDRKQMQVQQGQAEWGIRRKQYQILGGIPYWSSHTGQAQEGPEGQGDVLTKVVLSSFHFFGCRFITVATQACYFPYFFALLYPVLAPGL